jgi:hypothetical protein
MCRSLGSSGCRRKCLADDHLALCVNLLQVFFAAKTFGIDLVNTLSAGGRAANHPLSTMTFTPPIELSSPGALVTIVPWRAAQVRSPHQIRCPSAVPDLRLAEKQAETAGPVTKANVPASNNYAPCRAESLLRFSRISPGASAVDPKLGEKEMATANAEKCTHPVCSCAHPGCESERPKRQFVRSW